MKGVILLLVVALVIAGCSPAAPTATTVRPEPERVPVAPPSPTSAPTPTETIIEGVHIEVGDQAPSYHPEPQPQPVPPPPGQSVRTIEVPLEPSPQTLARLPDGRELPIQEAQGAWELEGLETRDDGSLILVLRAWALRGGAFLPIPIKFIEEVNLAAFCVREMWRRGWGYEIPNSIPYFRQYGNDFRRVADLEGEGTNAIVPTGSVFVDFQALDIRFQVTFLFESTAAHMEPYRWLRFETMKTLPAFAKIFESAIKNYKAWRKENYGDSALAVGTVWIGARIVIGAVGVALLLDDIFGGLPAANDALAVKAIQFAFTGR